MDMRAIGILFYLTGSSRTVSEALDRLSGTCWHLYPMSAAVNGRSGFAGGTPMWRTPVPRTCVLGSGANHHPYRQGRQRDPLARHREAGKSLQLPKPNLYFEELAGSILEHPMPCASWSGFLRLSLVSCPIYLSPATSRTKPLRLHQVWRPAAASEPDVDGSDRDRDERVGQPSTPWLVQPDAAAEPIKAAQRRGLRCARTTPERVRRSRTHKSSRDTNTTAASLSPSPLRS